MREWLLYLLLYFFSTGWAVYACLVFVFVPAVAALRASLHPERRARIWWSHAAIAVVLFAAFPRGVVRG